MSISKQGIVNTSYYSEKFINPYDTEYYIEPDNSVWIKIFHHNNPANCRFATTDDFTKVFYTDVDRWSAIPICNKITNNTYEFMVKSKQTTSGNEKKFRWIQTKNPLTATFSDVAVANVIKITGYDTYDAWGGLYAIKSSNTYFCANNGISGNWWGALGTYVLYQGGTPGWWNSVITTGCQDLFLRIDNQPNNIVSIYNNNIISNEFIEI